jgi:NAD(P) transhydrogenase
VDAQTYEIIVIGSGPAGYAAAGAAGAFGHRVALVERQHDIGGAGINFGTVPSKTLRETALALSGWRSRQLFGVDLSLRRDATIEDFMHHSKDVTRGERARIHHRLDEVGVEFVHGAASFVDPHTIRVAREGEADQMLRADFIVIATGSSPYRPPEFPFEDDRVHDSNELLDLQQLPKRLIVVGAGTIGSEYACTFTAMGAQTHLVDGRDELLPFLDREVSAALAAAMKANGIQFHWNSKVVRCDASRPGDVVLELSSGAKLAADGVLVCAGRQSNTAELNLAAAGIMPGKRGLIPVDEHYCSVVRHIYAAGDVIGPPALASTSMEQARCAVAHAFGIKAKADLAPIVPTGIYTIPEASMVGETEESLKEKGIQYFAGRAKYTTSPRGRIVGDESGFLKLLFHAADMRLLGVHVLGENATEVVHIGLVAMLSGAGADLFNRACFNYPTLGDLYKYATYDALIQREHAQQPTEGPKPKV